MNTAYVLKFRYILILFTIGAGKGTNTNFIMKERHLTAKPIVVSDLLDSPEARAAKAAGGMVGDLEVVQALLRELMDEKYRSGVVVDGFPRTKVQADIVRCVLLFCFSTFYI